MIRHCLLEPKQNIANAFNIIEVSRDFTPEEGGVLRGRDLYWFLYISNYNVCICKTASLILKKKKGKSLKSAANLNNSQNEEFCSSVKKKNFFLQNTNILMHVYHLILIKSFPILQTLPYTATQKILSVNKKPFI